MSRDHFPWSTGVCRNNYTPFLYLFYHYYFLELPIQKNWLLFKIPSKPQPSSIESAATNGILHVVIARVRPTDMVTSTGKCYVYTWRSIHLMVGWWSGTSQRLVISLEDVWNEFVYVFVLKVSPSVGHAPGLSFVDGRIQRVAGTDAHRTRYASIPLVAYQRIAAKTFRNLYPKNCLGPLTSFPTTAEMWPLWRSLGGKPIFPLYSISHSWVGVCVCSRLS